MSPTITPTSGSVDADAEIRANSRPEPKLQPMRVVQVPEQAPTPSAIATTRTAPGSDKKLVVGKKEYEAAKSADKKQPQVKVKPTPPTPEQQEILNGTSISNEARNMKSINNTNDTSLPDFPQDWEELAYKRVYRAWAQTPVSLSGVLSSESTFTPEKFMGRLVMASTGSTLIARISDVSGSVIEIEIPLANIKLMVTKERQ